MVRLEYFTREDFEQLKQWISTEELMMKWAGSLFRFPLTNRSLAWYIKDTNNLPTSNAYIYKAIDTDTGETIGHISLGGISKKNRSGRISRVLVGDTAARGKGYCKQMVSAVLKIGFQDLQLHRICLGVYDFNPAAVKCYESAGMIIEGKQRDVLSFKGEWWTLVEMSILESEWRDQQNKI